MEPENEEDVEIVTLHFPGFFLAHEDSEHCWCEPELTQVDEDGDPTQYTHRELQ